MKRNQLDELPERWTTVTLEDVATICYGRALPSDERLNDGGVPVYGSSGIVGEHHEALHKEASLIIGRKGSVGTVYLETRPFWCIDTAFYLDKVSQWVDLAFLAHALRVVDLRRLILVVGVPGINRNDLGAVKFPLPPLSEQQEIVEMLREADTLRQLRQQAVQKAEGLLPSLFYKMFGDPAENPMNWPIVKLGSLTELITSGPRGWGAYYSDEGPKFVRVQDLTGHRLNLEEAARISPPDSPEKFRSRIKSNDVLLAITGNTIGLSALAPEDIPEAYVNQHVAIIRLNDNVEPSFIAAFMSNEHGAQWQIQKLQQGHAKPGLNLSQIASLDLPLPPRSLQIEFSGQVRELGKIENEQKQGVEKTNDLYSALLARAFTGDLTNTYRIQQDSQLQNEEVERDVWLGLLKEKRTKFDWENTDQQNKLIRSSARQILMALAELIDIAADETSITQQSFPALTQMVEEIAPALPDKEERLFILIDSLLQNVQHGLRQQFVASAEAITQRILPFYQQDIDTKAVLEMLLKSAKKIDVVTPHAPQAARSIRAHITQTNRIDERLEKLLAAIEQRPPYFRAFDLVHDGIGLAETTAGLYILEALGFVRRVMWEADLDAVFRLVDPTNLDDAIHPNGEAR